MKVKDEDFNKLVKKYVKKITNGSKWLFSEVVDTFNPGDNWKDEIYWLKWDEPYDIINIDSFKNTKHYQVSFYHKILDKYDVPIIESWDLRLVINEHNELIGWKMGQD